MSKILSNGYIKLFRSYVVLLTVFLCVSLLQIFQTLPATVTYQPDGFFIVPSHWGNGSDHDCGKHIWFIHAAHNFYLVWICPNARYKLSIESDPKPVRRILEHQLMLLFLVLFCFHVVWGYFSRCKELVDMGLLDFTIDVCDEWTYGERIPWASLEDSKLLTSYKCFQTDHLVPLS